MKTIRNTLIPFLMIIILIVSGFSTRVLAAGVETWYSNWVDEPKITVTNNNLTPVKTMGVSGNLHIACYFKSRSDLEPSGCPNIKVTVQVRSTDGTVLISKALEEGSFWNLINISIPVTKGQKNSTIF